MSLKKKVISGAKWNTTSQTINNVSQLIITLFLARLLQPEDFGLLGMVVVFTGFIAILNDFGLGSAIIQNQTLDKIHLSSMFWFSSLLGLVFTLTTIAISPMIAQFYNQPILKPLTVFLSLSIFLSSLSSVHRSLLTKELKFKELTYVDIVSTILSGFVAIILAYLGYGIWSLAWRFVVKSFVAFIMIWSQETFRPLFLLKWSKVRVVMNYSLNLLGSNSINYLSRNVDYLLIGKMLGAEPLGYYTLAYQIMLFPIQQLGQLSIKTLFPAMSKIQDNVQQMREIYVKTCKYIAFISFPMMFGMFILAEDFILVVFGSKWTPAIIIIRILSIVGLLQSIATTTPLIYLPLNKADWLFKWNLFATPIVVIAITIGLKWGIVGVAISYAIASLLLTYLGLAIPFKLIKLKVLDFVLTLKEEIATSLIMFVVVMFIATIQRHYLLPSEIILISSIVIGILSYLVAVTAFNNSTYKELKRHIFNR